MKLAFALLLALTASPSAGEKMNRLADEKSPYLLQHAGNPVDWYPWGEAAFEKARREGKPVFLSIGYATCHWCHVMERESFADPKTAAILNKYYVAIKVDREERPDIDKIYMTAATGVGWGGGWPLSIWMTPDRKPFFGGTYFPPEPRWGQPAFGPLLERIGRMWAEKRADIAKDAEEIAGALRSSSAIEGRSAQPDGAWVAKGCAELGRVFDAEKGGFGDAPKFPMPSYQALLLRCHARGGEERPMAMVKKTLDAMASGGIYDHVGGGFHRYSTDADWFVPHFEKMLYDNAQLAVNYLEAYQAAKDPEHARVARETLDYVLRDMTHPEGGFYSAQDADSLPPELAAQGVEDKGHEHKAEGAYYLWTVSELGAALGPELSEMFAYRYGARPQGNVRHDPHGEFEGKNILFAEHGLDETAAKFKRPAGETARLLEDAKKRLREARGRRPRPFLDDKVLASWNGLMISAFAKGAQALDEPAYLAAAEKAARFIKARLYDAKARRLHHRWRDGHRSREGIADDYAFMIQGLLDLYEASFDTGWLDWAEELADAMRALFFDPKGGFFMTAAEGNEDLLMRVMEDSDGVEPCASSVAALSLLRLAQFTERRDLRQEAEKTLERFGAQMREQPRSLSSMLAAVDFATAKPKQVIIAGALDDPGTREMLRLVHARFIPGKIVVVADDKARRKLSKRLEVLKGMRPIGGKPTAYVCVNFACELPTNDIQTVAQILDGKHPVPR